MPLAEDGLSTLKNWQKESRLVSLYLWPAQTSTEKRLSLFVKVKSVREDGKGVALAEDLPGRVTEGSTERWNNEITWTNPGQVRLHAIDSSVEFVQIEKSDGSIVVLMSIKH